ncbi:flagellar filament capping protein FliD [uncultured Desulfobulbus sp.]|uniref:flagellar filament capping protein FliD n=1 Tax=uncultured Desulfobulbus sp. TaxID=239745 RepID=UPI0029C797F5|nr:flagellar filament capping protein FliD [uncultured Desulfobulbus sp.]
MSTISSTSTGTVTFAGLASGVDTDSIVDSLMEIESAPITTMEDKQTYLETKKDTYDEFNTLLESFYSAVTGLNNENDLNSFEVTNNGSEYFSISTTSLAEVGSYSVEIVSLAQQQKDVSANYVADTGTTSLSGTLQIGDQNLDYDSATLSGLVDQINEGTYGVTASMIDDGTGSGYRLMLTAETAGEELEIIGTGRIEMDTATDGHTVDGSLAHLVVDGVDYYSSSNTVTNAFKGSTITLMAVSKDGAVTLNINSDAQDVISTQLQEMVDAFNAMETFIDTIEASDSTLARSMISVQRSLRNYMTSSSFLSLGIQSDWETGELTFDTDIFDEAYDEDADAMKVALMGDDDNEGIMSRLDDYLTEQLNSTTGFLVTKTNSIDKQVSALDDKIDSMTTRLEKRRATLESQFAAMETLVSSLNSRGDYLTSFFESFNSTS